MQVALAIFALAGCNQVYDLEATQLRDGAGPDAPQRCTSAAPLFRGTPVSVIASGANDFAAFYSISLDRRIAVMLRAGTLWEGPGDSDELRGALLMPAPAGAFTSPRLAPEGDELFVAHPDTAASTTIARYARVDDRWVKQAEMFAVPGSQPELSIPTRRDLGPRHIVVAVGAVLREYVEMPADVWTLANSYTPMELGATTIQVPNLTADGLRLVFRSQSISDSTLLYASRERIGDRFGTALAANPFFGSPRLLDPYLLEDCSRLYFFVVANPVGVFYVEP